MKEIPISPTDLLIRLAFIALECTPDLPYAIWQEEIHGTEAAPQSSSILTEFLNGCAPAEALLRFYLSLSASDRSVFTEYVIYYEL